MKYFLLAESGHELRKLRIVLRFDEESKHEDRRNVRPGCLIGMAEKPETKYDLFRSERIYRLE